MKKLLNLLVLAGGLTVLSAVPAWAESPDRIAFGVAVELGKLSVVGRWLDDGLDPNEEADRVGTGLMIAAWEGNLPMMQLFVDHGADIARVNRHGEQALQLAAWRGHIEAVRWLLDHGASVNREGKQWSALHYAVFAGHGAIASLLMARGADVNARTPNDATPLMMAAREGREDLAQALVDAGADASLRNDRGDTALSWAMRQGNFRVAKLVSSAATFAAAVAAPPASFAPVQKSVPAPSEISELLEKLRQAESKGESSAALRQALAAAIDRFRKGSRPLAAKAPKSTGAGRRPTLVITASRKRGGERAVLVDAGQDAGAASSRATPAQLSWRYDERELDTLTALMRQLDAAQRAGQPTASLQQAVRQAYRHMTTVAQ